MAHSSLWLSANCGMIWTLAQNFCLCIIKIHELSTIVDVHYAWTLTTKDSDVMVYTEAGRAIFAIFFNSRIFASKYSFRIEYSESWSEFHIQIFVTYCFKLFRKGFQKSETSINSEFFSINSLRKEYSFPFLFVSHVKSADSLRCETSEWKFASFSLIFALNRISRCTLLTSSPFVH